MFVDFCNQKIVRRIIAVLPFWWTFAAGIVLGAPVLPAAKPHETISPISTVRNLVKGVTVLYAFDSFFVGPGDAPVAGIFLDKTGNILGPAVYGGTSGGGVLFQLSPSGSGFVESVLHSFSCYVDGCEPSSIPAVDSAGDLFVTTGALYGGIVRLSPSASGYQETAHYEFGSDDSYGQPVGTPLLRGNTLYVPVSAIGAPSVLGAIYAFTAPSLQPTLLYTFSTATGSYPEAGLIADGTGVLYGTTSKGGSANDGTVFKFVPSASGGIYSVIYNFQGHSDGAYPAANLLFDGAGNVYGTTKFGGYGDGTVFKLTPNGNSYSETVLYRFSGGDGRGPDELVLHDGTLWGTASTGGMYEFTTCSCGTIFSLSTSGANFIVRHSFAGPEGAYPNAAFFFNDGALYGSTSGGGPNQSSAGVVFRFVP